MEDCLTDSELLTQFHKNTPQLRFSGFDDDWEEKKLGEIVTEVKRKADSNSTAPIMMISATQGFINQSEKYSADNAGSSLKNYTLLKKGELSYNHGYSKTRNFGSCFTLGIDEARIPFVYHSFSLDSDDPSFFGKYLNSGLFDKELKKRVASTARMDGLLNISFDEYVSLIVKKPTLAEQQKIGAFLSHVDSLIQAKTKKLESLKAVKKSLLQKCFPKDGEKVPEMRFAGFSGDWEEKKLGDMGTTFTGLSGKSKEDFGYGNARYLTYISVYKNEISSIEGTDKINIDNSQNTLKYGDILFTTSSEIPEEVGLSSVWLGNEDNIYLNSFCFGYRLRDNIDLLYMAYLLRSFYVRPQIILLAQGISRYNISKYKVMDVKVLLPSLTEQQKIGQFFAKYDSLISTQQKEIDKLKDIKKSLLQKMFV